MITKAELAVAAEELAGGNWWQPGQLKLVAT